MQINIKKAKKKKQNKKNPTKRWGEKSRHFFKEDIQMAKKQVKRCSVSLLIREMQIKITVRCYLTLGQEWPSSKSLHQVSCIAGRFFTSWATHWDLTKKTTKFCEKNYPSPQKKSTSNAVEGVEKGNPPTLLVGM